MNKDDITMSSTDNIRSAFTLVELMIVVAIIGILAAVGITSFMEYQYRAKTSEVFTNVKGMMTA